jgi:hypothetical protein
MEFIRLFMFNSISSILEGGGEGMLNTRKNAVCLRDSRVIYVLELDLTVNIISLLVKNGKDKALPRPCVYTLLYAYPTAGIRCDTN